MFPAGRVTGLWALWRSLGEFRLRLSLLIEAGDELRFRAGFNQSDQELRIHRFPLAVRSVALRRPQNGAGGNFLRVDRVREVVLVTPCFSKVGREAIEVLARPFVERVVVALSTRNAKAHKNLSGGTGKRHWVGVVTEHVGDFRDGTGLADCIPTYDGSHPGAWTDWEHQEVYFTGSADAPTWSADPGDAVPLSGIETMAQGGAVYHEGAGRFLFLSGVNDWNRLHGALFEVEQPWGPWLKVADIPGGFIPSILNMGAGPNHLYFTKAGGVVTYSLNIDRIDLMIAR